MYFAWSNGSNTQYVRANKLFTSTHTWRRLKYLVSEKIWKASMTMTHFRFGKGTRDRISPCSLPRALGDWVVVKLVKDLQFRITSMCHRCLLWSLRRSSCLLNTSWHDIYGLSFSRVLNAVGKFILHWIIVGLCSRFSAHSILSRRFLTRMSNKVN